ncbi:MAG: 50S ribosomal protein L18 [Chloroflexi bacterium]|nr:50S ribosomal protein L18 [Chloroflexota bacterium]
MPRTQSPREARLARHRRVRRVVKGSQERPRLSVFRSLKHIYAQVIDDSHGHTLAAAGSGEPEARAQTEGGNKTALAAAVGRLLANRAKERGITRVVFDRGGFRYHGRVKALAEGARQGGLEF